MKLNTHLAFQGNCREAFDFYAQVLGGKITFMMTWGDSPMANEMPAESRNLIMHATLEAGEGVLMGADAPPGNTTKHQGFTVSLHLNDTAKAERIFNTLAEGGTVQMPMQETFWAARFGMAIDRFGIPWMINCEKAG